MSDVKITSSCPFGHVCEKHVLDANGQIIETNRCKLYIKLAGQHPQSGETVDQWDCSLVWSVVMSVENANITRSVAAATESFRNESIKAAETTNTILAIAANNASQRRLE